MLMSIWGCTWVKNFGKLCMSIFPILQQKRDIFGSKTFSGEVCIKVKFSFGSFNFGVRTYNVAIWPMAQRYKPNVLTRSASLMGWMNCINVP